MMELFLIHHADSIVSKHLLPLVAANGRVHFRETCRAARDSISDSQPKFYEAIYYSVACIFDSITKSVMVENYGIIAQNVAEVIPGRDCAAVRLNSGAVLTWGFSDIDHLLQSPNHEAIKGPFCFAARLHNGKVVTWGHPDYGEDSSDVQHLLEGVCEVIAGNGCFAARLSNGNVVTWGARGYGGDSSNVRHLLQDVAEVTCGNRYFAARLENGNVMPWGVSDLGRNSSSVQNLLQNIVTLQFDQGQFHAKSSNGQIISWP